MGRRSNSSSPFSLFSFQDIITSVTGVMLLLTLLLILELVTRAPASSTAADLKATEVDLRTSIEQMRSEIEESTKRAKLAAESVEEFAKFTESHIDRDIEITREQIETLRRELPLLKQRSRELKAAEDSALARALEREADRSQLEQIRSKAESLREKRKKLKNANILVYNRPPESSKQPWILDISAQRVAALPLGRPEEQIEIVGDASTLMKRVRQWTLTRNRQNDYFALLVRPSGIKNFEEIQTYLNSRGYEIGVDLIGEQQKVVDAAKGGGGP